MEQASELLKAITEMMDVRQEKADANLKEMKAEMKAD
jgi:hypothetical protein